MFSTLKTALLTACVSLTIAGSALALSQAEAGSIAERVLALNDATATQAFQTLNARGVFAVTDTAGDAAREIAFRVLELNDANATAAFNLLKGKGAFELAPVGGISAADRAALDGARAAASQCQSEMDRINPLVDEYNASWIPGRLKIRKEISATIERARAYLNRAQSRFNPYLKRTEAEVLAVGKEVNSALKEFNSYVKWWNDTFANQ